MTFIRYGAIQVMAYALDMGAFLLLIALFDSQPVLANIAGKGVAGVFAFFLHRHFTFQSTGGSSKAQAVRYFSLLAINIPVASALFGVGLYVVDSPAPVKFVCDVVCVALTYWISKLFVFHSDARPPAPADRAEGA
ncbi:GtrA family protein [Pseudomonas thivervalensis]|uniref:GtrA family protein n=1 Tax=Pseudomonas thivervalensis TaxID=86265 RepID=UPI00069F2110|nr:GtrA family protein [Pseudomonas thivervalensis]OAB49258.1 polysaccharide synthesis protein GtrA [Pseudomonas thivervalensis]SDF79172.1 Putative flippase GtrA (transmembrane translocase of bactoprenol-linked glucose) [Pseudomonas thivervalensis]